MPAWVDHAIWWHVYPLGFCGAPATGSGPDAPVEHRLRRIASWLDYAVELGCNGLVLGPIFASETHGYDTTDHLRVDPRLGDLDDWDALVAAARSRGVRLVLDGVFNHVGRQHPRVVQAVADGPDSAAGRWLRWRPGPDGTPEPDVFEGHGGLVALDHANPEVAAYVADVMTTWLDRGADGWRLDAAFAVPATFWRRVLPQVRAAHPDAWVLGEMIHGDYAAYVAESGLDSITQYELWKAIWSSILDRNFHELAWALGRHDAFAASFLPYTFVGNHDVTRIASTVTDGRHVTHALAVLFFVAGTPSVYAGDEQGFRGVKEERFGGDDAIRPEFPTSPDQLAPDGWGTYREHERLIGLRRRHPWLAHAQAEVVHVANDQLVLAADAPGRPDSAVGGSDAGPGPERLVLSLNLGDLAFTPPVGSGAVLLRSAGAGRPGETFEDGTLVVPPHEWVVSRHTAVS